MTKDEVLRAAKEKGMMLTGKMIQRYVELGLIVSYKDGQGYACGVSTYYDARTLDTILRIRQLQKNGKMLKDMIFILACEGYPVRWDKLKEKLIEYQTTVMDSFRSLAYHSSHPDFSYYLNEIAEESVERPKTIGRPSKALSQKHQKDIVAFYANTQLVVKMVASIINHSSIPYELFHEFSRLAGMNILVDDSIHKAINIWLTDNEILDGAREANQGEILQCLELLPLYKQYWDVLVCSFGGIEDIPYVGHAMNVMQESLHIQNFLKMEEVIKYILYMSLRILTIESRSELIRLLSRTETLTQWKCICNVIAKGGESIWEVLGLPLEGEKPLPLQHG